MENLPFTDNILFDHTLAFIIEPPVPFNRIESELINLKGWRERNFGVARRDGCDKGTSTKKIKVGSDVKHLPWLSNHRGSLWHDIFRCNIVCESQRWTRRWERIRLPMTPTVWRVLCNSPPFSFGDTRVWSLANLSSRILSPAGVPRSFL